MMEEFFRERLSEEEIMLGVEEQRMHWERAVGRGPGSEEGEDD